MVRRSETSGRRLAPKAPPITHDELRVVAELEGKPWPRAKDLAKARGISLGAAFRLLAQLKRAGRVRLIDTAARRCDACECVVYLQLRLSDAQACAALDRRLAGDPAVLDCTLVTGIDDYRLSVLHADHREAEAWLRALLAQPAVTRGRQLFVRTLFARQHFAAAILGGPR